MSLDGLRVNHAGLDTVAETPVRFEVTVARLPA